MNKKNAFKLFGILCILSLVLSACNLPLLQKTPTASTTQTSETSSAPVLTAADVYGGSFATYQEKVLNIPAKYQGGYSLPLDLGSVTNLGDFPLSSGQENALKGNGFVVLPPTNDANKVYTEFYQAYESIRYDQTPVFVTTDSIYHVYHLVFDKMLRDLERDSFIAAIKELTTTMVAATTAQYQTLKGTTLEDAALRNVAFFSIAASLLNTGDAVLPEAQAYVDAELALINAHSGISVSPLWKYEEQASDLQLIEDYSQYIPRGHYTLSPELEAYFKAMMWYGRLTYRLKDTFETQRALLLTQAMRTATSSSGNSALTLWHEIYDPTVFIVGKADDLGIDEYGKISDVIFGVNPDLVTFGDATKMQSFIETAKKLPAPQVNSMWVWIWQDRNDVTQGFRFMGQRFTLDEYVFGQLMWRNVGTLDKPRDLPKALDFFAATGSDKALSLLVDMGENNYPNYDTQMTKVKTEVSKLELDSWTQNLYWSWLYALQSITAVKGEQYPVFMQTDAWAKKDLQTALSSWTELKHDTILYSKQVMAEMGGGGPETPPMGYVEPNPEAYARLLALAQMTRSGLESRNILSDTTRGNLDNLIEELTFLTDISQKELNHESISDEDYWSIQYYGGWLEALTIASADTDSTDSGRNYLEDQKSAVVADVATGVGRVLEEGVGYPTLIYVVTPTSPYQIAVGAVYTYYEFTVSPDKRMTDDDWRNQLVSGTPPTQPDWTSSFIVP
ncbi:MAG: DUF3160 domain-containing protein [Anaerolineaceae bacterium]